RTFSKVLTFFVSFFVSRQKMKKAKHGQGGCLSTSWQGIAGRARNDEPKRESHSIVVAYRLPHKHKQGAA
ncbi:MAG: hypothetical protein ACRCZB_06770, partial [Bacteroidales bacterium]